MRPGVVENDHRVLGEVLGQRRLQPVVVGGEDRREQIDRSVTLVRTDLVQLLRIPALTGPVMPSDWNAPSGAWLISTTPTR